MLHNVLDYYQVSIVIPAQCPECGAIAINVRRVPPREHSRGDQYATYAECDECSEYGEWFDK